MLAILPTRDTAEHMLASLGREFRRTARRGQATALIVGANGDVA